jgi:uncharacterized repeat protein (TIGR03803 family)
MLSGFRITRTCRLCVSALAVLALQPSSVFAAPTVRFRILHEFHGTDGVASVAGPLVKGVDGRLYGALPSGGLFGNGVLFSVTPQGDFQLLHSFSGGLDGAQPNTLFRDPDGHIYGATAFGGAHPDYGVLFSVGADGTPTVVHNFMGSDGGQINGSIVQFKQGRFYGTSGVGGSGSVYRFTPPSTVETLYQFGNGADQNGPYFGLSKAGGVFYGTTYSDLSTPSSPTYGTVFRVTDSGELTVLYTFTGGTDGSRPVGPPVRAADGNFYGVASQGGEFGCGTIYRIDSTGVFTLVHAFTGNWDATDGGGCTPFATLLKGKDGMLYGSTASGGGEYGLGLIFRLSLSGEVEVLHKFQDPNVAGGVMFPLIEGREGTFFGMTTGTLGNTGSVFKLVVRDTE